MADLRQDYSFLDLIDPSGKLRLAIKGLEDGLNKAAKEANVAPVGERTVPPKISGFKVTANSSGFHSYQIVDNEPPAGTVYHVEAAIEGDAQFSNPQPVVSNTPYRNSPIPLFVGDGGFHYRAYSTIGNGPPSPLVYFGSPAAPTLVKSPGSAVAPGPEPLPSTGSGSGSSELPQGGTGFGSNPGQEAVLGSRPAFAPGFGELG